MSQGWFESARFGEIQDVLNWIDRGADVDQTNESGCTALFFAARTGRVDLIRVLLDHGADPNMADERGCTPTTHAVYKAQAGASHEPDPRPLEMLLAAGGKLGFLEAVLKGDVELARRLCDADPKIDVSADARFCFHDTYLMEAVKLGFLDMVRFLLDRGADIEGTDDLGATALMRAAAAGYASIVELLIGRGADIDHDDWSDQTPLSEAATGGHRPIVDLLLSRGAERGLLDAVALDDARLVAELLRDGADPNHVYYGQGRLAMYAVTRGQPDTVRLLLDHGADHHDESFDPHPLLVEAARRGHVEVARLLLARGADLDGVGKDGMSARDWAAREGHAAIVELLDRAEPG